MFKVKLLNLCGQSLGELEVEETITGEEFKSQMSALNGKKPEAHDVVTIDGERIQGNRPVSEWLRSEAENVVTVVELTIPTAYDEIGKCDLCRTQRYLYNCYDGMGVWVISLCRSCGGRPQEQQYDIDD